MDDIDPGVASAESPPAESAGTPSAGTLNAAPAQPTEQQIPYARFQQIVRENQGFRQNDAQRQQEVAQLRQELQKLQQQAAGPARTADERQQRTEAIKALKELMGEDDELKDLPAMRKELLQLKQGYQGVQQITQAQQQAQQRQAFTHIEQLAKSASLPTDKANLTRLVRLVAQEAQSIPDAEQRYAQGDLSLFDDAFKAINEGFLGQFRRDAVAPVITAKNRTRQLPPASTRGGPPGAAAPLKLVEGKEREYQRAIHQGADARLRELQGS